MCRLLRDGAPIGAIGLFRTVVMPFTEKQIELVTTFADQAVIAIENVRLFEEVQARTREVTEALERQTATSKVLSVISRSTFDIQPVLETIVETAGQLCRADRGNIWKITGGKFEQAAGYRIDPAFADFLARNPAEMNRGNASGRAVLERRTIHIEDTSQDPEYAWSDAQKAGNFRTILGVPLLRDGEPLGSIALLRERVEPFSEKEIELVTTFANQAVIAIENARLFAEIQARTRELTEALEYQTATSEVLRVISKSPGDVEPIFQAMLENAMRICQAKYGVLFEFADGAFRALSSLGVPAAFDEHVRQKRVWGPKTGLGKVVSTMQAVHVLDVREEDAYAERDPNRVASVEKGGMRTVVCVPMLKDDELVGALGLFPPGSPPLHRSTDRAGHDLRQPGGHRHRECAPSRRASGPHARAFGIARASDGDFRGPWRHLALADGRATRVRCYREVRGRTFLPLSVTILSGA